METGPDSAVFTSPAGQGPRFRLAYRRNADATLGLTFEIASPGRDFSPYLTATLKRK